MENHLPKGIIIPVVTLKSGVFCYKEKAQSLPYNDVPSRQVKENVLYPKLDAFKDGKQKVAAPGCSVVYEDGASKLFFKIPDQKLFQKTGEIKYTMLECTDISAADLKVSTKFGYWSSLSCRLLIECTNPLISWSTLTNAEVKKTIKKETGSVFETEDESPQSPAPISYIASPQESCMVKVTLDVAYITNARDMLETLKAAKLKERKAILEKHKKGVDKHVRVPSKIREGLPNWVNYIPAKWYSSTIRKVIEYILVIYTILTLAWAVWQLYKHVDFIRHYLRPILQFIELYFKILKTWFKWLDGLMEVLSKYWWKYMKPVYLLAAPLYASLAQLFKPLRNIAGLITTVFEPIIRFFGTILTFLQPLLQPFRSCFGVSSQVFRKMFDSVLTLWTMVVNTAGVQLIISKCNQLGLSGAVHQVVHGGLDPFKAQVMVIQGYMMKIIKGVIRVLKFIFTRIVYVNRFVKRERDLVTEEQSVIVGDDDKPKME